jgi:hypothetical protein
VAEVDAERSQNCDRPNREQRKYQCVLEQHLAVGANEQSRAST